MTARTDLAGRLAVVSGAGSGIGAGLAAEAVARGMKVLALDVDADRLAALESSLGADNVRGAVVDVSDPVAVARAAREAIDAWGPAALVCCNAGIEFAGRAWDMTPAQWRRLQGVNVDGAFHLVQAFLPSTIAEGRPAHVLMTSSVGGLAPGAGQAAYIVSKYAVRVLAQCLREDLAEAGHPIGVSVLLPGPVRTNIFADATAAGASGEGLRGSLASMLDEHGTDPREVAVLALDAVEGDRFWVHPHPDFSAAFIEAQHEELAGGLSARSLD